MSHRILAVGEILWDLLPSGKQLGGAPTNFAYHAHALGADARVVSRVGNDPLGHEILDRLRSLGLPTDGIGADTNAPTGTVSVELSADGQPRFAIHENVAWDRLAADEASLAFAARADAVCFGSLAQRSAASRQAIHALVTATPAAALRVFDINLRQQFYSREVIESSLTLANALKLNDAELPVLAAMFGLGGGVREQLAALAERFGLRAVALTRGAHGSLLYVAASLRDAEQDDRRSRSDQTALGAWSEHPGLRVKVVDAVGAGDAFTAAWTLGLLAGQPLDKINHHANEVAAYVCSQSGATPTLPKHWEGRLPSRPSNEKSATWKSPLPVNDSQTPFLNPFETIERHANRLPHWQQDNATYFVTFHLADSIPQEKLARWLAERDAWLRHNPQPWNSEQQHEHLEHFARRIEEWLDAGEGSCLLRSADVGRIVGDSLNHFEGQRYCQHAWVVMPNHVHALFSILDGTTLETLLQSWKGYTARAINKSVGHEGTLWQKDYFDRMIRDAGHFWNCARYIRNNPVKAKLQTGEFLLHESDHVHNAQF